MITTLSFIPSALALLSFSNIPINQPLINPAPVSSGIQDEKPLTQSEMENRVAKLKQSFVQLLADDGRTKQCWALLSDLGNQESLYVRTLDAYQFGKLFSSLYGISVSRAVVVMNRNWKSEPASGQAVSFRDAFFPAPIDGDIKGILLYPGIDGTVHQVTCELIRTKPDKTKGEIAGRLEVSLPTGHDSGIAIFIRGDGKTILVPVDAADKVTSMEDNGFPFGITLRQIAGEREYVNPLTNASKVTIAITSKDEVQAITEAAIKDYVSLFLNEECPRLSIMSASEKLVANPFGMYRFKNNTEKLSVMNLLGQYDRQSVAQLSLNHNRSASGLYFTELVLQAKVTSNGGSTVGTLYRDAVYGVNLEKSDIVRDHVKFLVKRFADKWIVANPRDKD